MMNERTLVLNVGRDHRVAPCRGVPVGRPRARHRLAPTNGDIADAALQCARRARAIIIVLFLCVLFPASCVLSQDCGWSWRPITQDGAPPLVLEGVNPPPPERIARNFFVREANSAVWTGKELVVFGGMGMGVDFWLCEPCEPCNAKGCFGTPPEEWPSQCTAGTCDPCEDWTCEFCQAGETCWYLYNNAGYRDAYAYDPKTNRWRRLDDAPVNDRAQHTAVWASEIGEMIVWGGRDWTGGPFDYPKGFFVKEGDRLNPTTGTWDPNRTPQPANMCMQEQPGGVLPAVWTGEEKIIWGGQSCTGVTNRGLAYNPGTNTWRDISTAGAPSPRYDHAVVWTGEEMIVWGGFAGKAVCPPDGKCKDGGAYNPATDTWRTLALGPLERRGFHAMARTGTEVLILGGAHSTAFLNDGATYDPKADSWTNYFTLPELNNRQHFPVVSTGKDILIWGGGGKVRITCDDLPIWGNGFRYDPKTGQTTEIPEGKEGAPPRSALWAPAPRFRHAALWTGTEMIVWGGGNYTTEVDCDGCGGCLVSVNTGAVYRAPASYYGDRDNDGRVDGADLGILSRSFGLKPGEAGYDPRADIYGPDGVDAYDLTLLTEGFGERYQCP